MEDFLEFSIVHDMTGKGLSTSILQLLEKFGHEKKFLVGQGWMVRWCGIDEWAIQRHPAIHHR